MIVLVFAPQVWHLWWICYLKVLCVRGQSVWPSVLPAWAYHVPVGLRLWLITVKCSKKDATKGVLRHDKFHVARMILGAFSVQKIVNHKSKISDCYISPHMNDLFDGLLQWHIKLRLNFCVKRNCKAFPARITCKAIVAEWTEENFEENRREMFYWKNESAGRLQLVCCDDDIGRVEQLELSHLKNVVVNLASDDVS